jgi:hypothetical protein
MSPGIDSKESNPPAYVAWRAGTTPYSYSVPSPHRLFKNSSSDNLAVFLERRALALYLQVREEVLFGWIDWSPETFPAAVGLLRMSRRRLQHEVHSAAACTPVVRTVVARRRVARTAADIECPYLTASGLLLKLDHAFIHIESFANDICCGFLTYLCIETVAYG